MIQAAQRTIHFNLPQLKVMALNANEMYIVAGRGTGKSQGILAPHDFRCLQLMPRACGLLIGSNFRKMMTDLIPPYVAGLERMGWKRDVDFVIGQSDIPKRKGWKDPYIAPEPTMRQFFLHTKHGSGIRFASQDRKVTLNGTEVDWIKGDEAKHLNFERYKKEILPTNRGRSNLWGHLPEHHSIMFTTDKLFDRKGGDWIMGMKHRVDPELINAILQLQCKIYEVEEQYALTEIPPDVFAQLNEWKKHLASAQSVAVAFIEADSLDNIHALGWKAIKQWMDNLSPAEFDVAILNKDKVKMDGGFYPNLDYHIHGYDATDYTNIDNFNYNFDRTLQFTCLDDTDCIPAMELEISIDWGGHMNGMIICQEVGNQLNIINCLYTKPPDTYKELAVKFVEYYQHHKNKCVYMHYDPSGNNARADSQYTYADEFAAILRQYGWVVIMRNTITTNPKHHTKYLLWQQILSEKDPRFPVVRINRHNCDNLFTSMLNAPIKVGNTGFQKDKSSERANSGTPPEHATHFSDMADIIIWNKYKHTIENDNINFITIA